MIEITQLIDIILNGWSFYQAKPSLSSFTSIPFTLNHNSDETDIVCGFLKENTTSLGKGEVL